jgi:hypothetical protein
MATGEWKDPVTGTEPGVDATLDQLDADLTRQQLRRGVESVRPSRIRDVIQPHTGMVSVPRWAW